MTPAQFKAGRNALGLSQHAMARALNMGTHGWQSILRWEKDGTTVPGPAQVAMRFMLRDAGVTLDFNNEGKDT